MTQPAATEHRVTDAAVQERAGAYLLFARLFREAPTAELLHQLIEQRLLTAAEQWGSPERSFDPVEDALWPTQAEAIAVEYAQLFSVPGDQAVRPYESVYCDTLAIDTTTACSPYFQSEPLTGGLSGFLHGTSTSAVQHAYQQAGFAVDPSCHELPDHLAIELEFMGRLLERGEVDQAKTFFTDHLDRWVFRCLDEIRHKTSSGFYRAVVDALLSFLQREQEHFSLRV